MQLYETAIMIRSRYRRVCRSALKLSFKTIARTSSLKRKKAKSELTKSRADFHTKVAELEKSRLPT